MARHVVRGLVLECPIEGLLPGDAVGRLGMHGLRSPPQAHEDMAPSIRVPRGVGEWVSFAPGKPFGGGGAVSRECLGTLGSPPPS